jgi:hypothetical protein
VSAAPPPPPAARPQHRILVPSLFAVATLIGFVACFAVWVNREALNTGNWTKTSTEILANRQVDEALSTYLVNQLYTSVDVAGEIKSTLPKEVQGLAGPAAAGLRVVADRVVPQLLATSQVQNAWRRANQTAHSELLKILGGGGRVVSTSGGVVTLDLHELVAQLAAQLGVEKQVAAAQEKLNGSTGELARSTAQQKLGVTLPPTSGRIVIMRAKQLRTAQDIATAIRGLAIVLPLLSLIFFALAVGIAGGRRVALRTTGWCLFGIGIAVLLARRIAGNVVVDNLVVNPSNRPAAHAVWSIGTSLLHDIALSVLVYGLVFVAGAWLMGATRAATTIRRSLAAWAREHAAGSYAVAEGTLLLLVLWNPTPATGRLLPVLGFAVLLALGVRIFRRETAAEFPDAKLGATMAAMRVWARGRREQLGGREWRAGGPGAGLPTAAGSNGADADARLALLERLAALHERGVLTDEEFAAEKSLALGGPVGPPTVPS